MKRNKGDIDLPQAKMKGIIIRITKMQDTITKQISIFNASITKHV